MAAGVNCLSRTTEWPTWTARVWAITAEPGVPYKGTTPLGRPGETAKTSVVWVAESPARVSIMGMILNADILSCMVCLYTVYHTQIHQHVGVVLCFVVVTLLFLADSYHMRLSYCLSQHLIFYHHLLILQSFYILAKGRYAYPLIFFCLSLASLLLKPGTGNLLSLWNYGDIL